MKTLTEKEDIVTNLKSETQQYTIASSPKAFSVLMDKLYSDKIGSIVRELTSNAHDAHADAKRLDVQFEVTCPTALAPTFSVRDFGESMSHEFVMKLYSSVFYSSKEETNDQVGTFGLGSKSPFAYADGFNLATFRDGKVNLYSAFYNEDRVPSITHIAEKNTKEPNGTYVSFQVSSKDIQAFQTAIGFVYRCYWRNPFKLINMDAPELIESNPLLGVDHVHLVSGNINGWQRNCWFSQGNVWYPIPERFLNIQAAYGKNTGRQPTDEHINYAQASNIMIEVPIGTFNITPSREAISLDKYSVESINNFLRKTREELVARVDELYSACKTRLDYHRVYTGLIYSAACGLAAREIVGPLGYKFSTTKLNIISDREFQTHMQGMNAMTWFDDIKVADTKPGFLYTMVKSNVFNRVSTVQSASKVKLFVGLERNLVRKIMRCKLVNSQHTFFCHTQDAARFVRILGLRPGQVYSLNAIPDPGSDKVKAATPVAQPTYKDTEAFFLVTSNGLVAAKDPFMLHSGKEVSHWSKIDGDWITHFWRSLTSSFEAYDKAIYTRMQTMVLRPLYYTQYSGDNTSHLWTVLLDIVGGEDKLVEHMANAGLWNTQREALPYKDDLHPASTANPIADLYGFITQDVLKGHSYRINSPLASAWAKWPFETLKDRIEKEIGVTNESYQKTLANIMVDYPIFTAQTPNELRKYLEVLKCKTSNT